MSNEDVTFRFHQLLANFSDIVNHSKIIKRTRKQNEDLDIFISNKHIHPLERYLDISSHRRRIIFYKDIAVGRIIIGKISNILGTTIKVTLLGFIDGQNKWIRDLKVTASVDMSTEVMKKSGTEEYEVGDIVKAVVVSVQPPSSITLSFDDKMLKENQTKYFPLGKINHEEFILNMAYESEDEDKNIYFNDDKSLLKDLQRSTSYINPSSVNNLVQYFDIDDDNDSFLPPRKKVVFVDDVEHLRDKQSFKWSMDMRANNNDMKLAVEDFKEALRMNPAHRNGRKYLIETLKLVAKGLEKEYKWKEASRCYKDILDINDEDQEAKERSRQIKQILSQKIVSGRSLQQQKNSSFKETDSIRKELSNSTKYRISKLKRLLEAESKYSETSSSTSSSSTSSSESSSSADEGSENEWIEKQSEKQNRTSPNDSHLRERSDYHLANSIREIREQTTRKPERVPEIRMNEGKVTSRDNSSQSIEPSRIRQRRDHRSDSYGPSTREKIHASISPHKGHHLPDDRSQGQSTTLYATDVKKKNILDKKFNQN